MSTSSIVKAAAVQKKRSVPKKRLLLIEEEPVAQEPVAQEPVAQESAPQEPAAQEPAAQEPAAQEPVPRQSIWMQMRRIPKVKPEIVWEGVEDISDDEDDTPQAAGRRLSHMKATRNRMQSNYYTNVLVHFQNAGLFLNW
jgi:hypothetical protein